MVVPVVDGLVGDFMAAAASSSAVVGCSGRWELISLLRCLRCFRASSLLNLIRIERLEGAMISDDADEEDLERVFLAGVSSSG